MDYLNSISKNFPVLHTLQQKSGNRLRQEHILLIILAACTLAIVLLPIASLVANVLAMLLLVQTSIRVLVAGSSVPVNVLVAWQTYGLFVLVESTGILRVLPMYYLVKIALVNAVLLDARVCDGVAGVYRHMRFMADRDMRSVAREAVEMVKEKSRMADDMMKSK